MDLKTSHTEEQGVSVLTLSGRITLGEGAGLLRNTLKDLVAKGHKNILLDLGGVSYIDSAGLGELVGCFVSVNNQGGKLKLVNLGKKLQGLMQITKLHTVFEVFEDKAEAVASFGRAAGAN